MIPASEDCPGSCGCPRPRSDLPFHGSIPPSNADSDRLCCNFFGLRGSRFAGLRLAWRDGGCQPSITDSIGAEDDPGSKQSGGD